MIPESASPKPRRTVIVHEGHEHVVNTVAFCPDGKSIISGSSDDTIRIWEAHSTLSLRDPIKGHTHSVESIAYSPTCSMIASGSLDNTIRLWDPKSGYPIGQPRKGHHGGVNSVAFSPCASLLVSGSSDSTVRLWDLESEEHRSTLFGAHYSEVTSVMFSSDGTRVVSGSLDTSIWVWDVERRKKVVGPLEHSNFRPILSVAFSPGGSQILSGSSDGTLELWDVRTGRMINKPNRGHDDRVSAVAFSPDDMCIASGSDDETVHVWDLRASCWAADSFEYHGHHVTSIAFSPCGAFIASASRDRSVMVWSISGEDTDSNYTTENDPLDDTHTMGPQWVSSHMSLQDVFNLLLQSGCTDLSSQIDTTEDNVIRRSGGGFGDIWAGKMGDGTRVAIKTWRADMMGQFNYKDMKRAARELHAWSRMKHENIHELMGVIIFKGYSLGMVSKWMENGNLHEYMRRNPRADRYQLCVQVTTGLEYMHSCNMVHGDIKSLNVLVSSDGVAKISDFDFTIMLEAGALVFSNSSNQRGGSFRWTAPELLADPDPKDEKGPDRTKQTDVYALGMTMLEIFTGEVPYSQYRSDQRIFAAVIRGTLPDRPGTDYLKDDRRGNQMWELLKSCWDRNPDTRPPANQALQSLDSIITGGI